MSLSDSGLVEAAIEAASVPPAVAPPAGAVRADQHAQRGAARIGNLVLCAFGVLFVLPMLWLVFASVDAHATWGIEVPHFTWSNFSQALGNGGLGSLGNSLLLSVVATAVSTVAAGLAAFALARRRIPWRGPILLLVLFLTAIPISIIIVPIYQLYVNFGWLSLVPSAVFLGVTSLPFEIWLLKNYIEALPVDLEEAAAIERASTFQVLRRIVVPLTLPGIAASAIFGFINAWGSFIVPLVLISDPSQQTGPITIYGFIGAANVKYGDIAAFSLLYSVPVFLLYAAMSRLFRGGFVLHGAVRG